MKSKTHIIILHMKEIIYTVIFAALAVILIILLIYMFSHKKTEETMAAIPDYAAFTPPPSIWATLPSVFLSQSTKTASPMLL